MMNEWICEWFCLDAFVCRDASQKSRSGLWDTQSFFHHSLLAAWLLAAWLLAAWAAWLSYVCIIGAGTISYTYFTSLHLLYRIMQTLASDTIRIITHIRVITHNHTRERETWKNVPKKILTYVTRPSFHKLPHGTRSITVPTVNNNNVAGFSGMSP